MAQWQVTAKGKGNHKTATGNRDSGAWAAVNAPDFGARVETTVIEGGEPALIVFATSGQTNNRSARPIGWVFLRDGETVFEPYERGV